MTTSRGMRAVAFGALAVTSVFWFWSVAELLSVHWPNNGQDLVATPLLLAGSGIIGFGLVYTIVEPRTRHTEVVATTILEGISIASLVAIVGTIVFYLLWLPFFLIAVALGYLPLSWLAFPALGVAGSAVAILLYAKLRDRVREVVTPVPPPGAIGSDQSV